MATPLNLSTTYANRLDRLRATPTVTARQPLLPILGLLLHRAVAIAFISWPVLAILYAIHRSQGGASW